MANDLYRQYRETAVTQADPIKLVEMLYEGAIKFMRMGQKAIADGDPETAHNNILRAYAIVAELMATLDFDEGGEIATRLEQCYDYTLHLLKEANIKKDGELLDQAVQMIEPLLASWKTAFKNGVPGSAADDGMDEEHPDEAKAEQQQTERPKRDHKPLDLVG
ncbi:flagellar export chaperone FliS [bacterium]|nr:flagellar export chaperone FliS [bacterium]